MRLINLLLITLCLSCGESEPTREAILSNLMGYWEFSAAYVHDNITYTSVYGMDCFRPHVPAKFYQPTEIVDIEFHDNELATVTLRCYGNFQYHYNWYLSGRTIYLVGGSLFRMEILDISPTLLSLRMVDVDYQPHYTFRK